MISFKQYIRENFSESHTMSINEAVSVGSMERVSKLIISYFSRNLGKTLVKMPGGEDYFNSTGPGFGVRFFFPSDYQKVDSIRFNWRKKHVTAAAVDSVDVFYRGKNLYNISFDRDTSLVKILPFVLDFLKNPRMGTVTSILKEGVLLEELSGNPIKTIGELLVKKNITMIMKSELKDLISANLKSIDPQIASKIYTALKTVKPDLLIKKNLRTYMLLGNGELTSIADTLFNIIFIKAKITTGSTRETYTASPEVENVESQGLEKLAFETQLSDMKEAVRMLYRGITNSVFIGGRGGIGKTHNVEATLEELGLRDGAGYFKNAGSISASGLYRMLFTHRDGLILFDDSDSVFGDQEARNILKAATDTKKSRKIAWAKKSSDVVAGDAYTDEQEGEGKFPSFFEFTGRIIFISNLPIEKLDPDGALRTRGILMEIAPTADEVYNLMEKLIDMFKIADGLTLSTDKRLEVVKLLRENPKKEPNFRTLERALNMRAGASPGFDWKKFVMYYA